MEIKLTNENFENEVLKSEIPVLVDFYATWCGPCQLIAPIMEDIAKEYEGKAKVGKVDVDEAQALAIKYGVSSIPTLIVFKNGQPIGKVVGLRPKDAITKLLD